MKKSIFLVLIPVLSLIAFTADKPAYKIFDKQGKEVTYDEMVAKLKDAEAVFFGELHDNPIAHWMELEITKSLYEVKKENLMLGAEMFESDNQLILNEYLWGIITEAKFEDEARLWPNYKTDYKPIVSFAKLNKLKFIATNVPRRYASIVSTGGFEALDKLSAEAARYISPTPIAYDPSIKCYKDMLQMGGMTGGGMQKPNENLPKAQALKDATMAYFIMQNWTRNILFLHFNGSYHSDNNEGIIWHIMKKNKDLKIFTITTVTQDNISTLNAESQNIADFTICVPESMTRTQ